MSRSSLYKASRCKSLQFGRKYCTFLKKQMHLFLSTILEIWAILAEKNFFYELLIYILSMHYLQYERPCCICYTNSSRRRFVVYPIQHGQ